MDKKPETKIIKEINDVLNSFGDKYIIQNVVNKAKVIQDLDDYNEELIGAILANEVLSNQFVIEVNGVSILKVNQLIEVFQLSDYWMDSYTRYSKKIGLVSKGKFLDEVTDVVLDFPYKDTILKASMSKEEKEQEDLLPDEPFLNEVVAKEEIDVLLDKKILVNARKYDINGEHKNNEFSENDNLILKGNNLLALHTLKEQYAGKVKLIFIDPPYNTGNDSFNYNDKFNHSTWLTFMKNRLEVAKELLSDDGSIWVTLDNMEAHYMKILMDEIFGREKFFSNIIWQNNKQSKGYKGQISLHHNELIVYRKSESFKLGLLPRTEADNKNYKNPDNDPKGPWRASDVRNSAWRPNLQYDIIAPNGNVIKHPEKGWRFSEETFNKELSEGKIKFSDDNKRVIRKIHLANQEGRVVESVWGTEVAGSTREANTEIKALFGDGIFATPKPEKLISRILSIGSNEEDLILDFFMGSATTQAVAMKMNRRFIGIEQMDYINTVSVPRLQKVIGGEQGGVSKEVNWEGGGSFIYAELMEKNQGFLKTILNAKEITTLKETFNLMLNTGDFDFQVDLNEVGQTLWDFPIEEQKKILVKIIDKNQLYFHYSEIDDENVREFISESDYIFNKSFYGK